MPYVKKGSQTEIGQKIEELAKKVPAPLSWVIPDPYSDPTGGFGLTPSPIALTRGEMIRKFSNPLRESGWKASGGLPLQSYIEAGENFINRLPRKVVEFVNDLRVKLGAKVASYQGSPQRFVRLADPSVVPPEKYYRGLVHEVGGHALQETLVRKDLAIYRRMAENLKAYEESLAEAMAAQLTKKPGLLPYRGAAEDIAEGLRFRYTPGQKIPIEPELLKWRIEYQPYLAHRQMFDAALEGSTDYELFRKVATFLKALDQGWRPK